MNKQRLSILYQWYKGYVGGFKSDDAKHQRNIDIKDQHTKRVCKNIIDIGRSLNLDKNNLQIAEAVALLHDLGRFPQYDRYRTYSDAKSEDHAKLGIKVIQQHDVLIDIDPELRDLMLRSIGYHNKKNLPVDETDKGLMFTKLLRDADKLDIFKVVTDYYLSKNETKNEVLELWLPNIPKISNKVILDVKKGATVDYNHVKTLSDFKMLQMSWIYDINYSRTCQLIKEHNYIGIIYDSLLNKTIIENIYGKFARDLDEMC